MIPIRGCAPNGSTSRHARLTFALLTILVVSLPSHAASQQVAPVPASPATLPDLTGKVALVTGSTDGLGREVARRLASAGAHVIVHGRSVERGRALVDELSRLGKGSARFYAADFASLDAVHRLADEVLRDYQRLDLLVNNAGVGFIFDSTRKFSAEGHEMHFAVNYLAHYVLTHRLLPRLLASAPSRVINVSSGSQTAIDFDDPMMEKGYSGARGYAQSKLAQILMTVDMAPTLEPQGVLTYALHPATTMNTTMARALKVTPRSTVEEGGESVVNAIVTSAPTGSYFNRSALTQAHAQAYDANARAKLRALSERLTGPEARARE